MIAPTQNGNTQSNRAAVVDQTRNVPFFTIITVVRNGEATLGRTIQSVEKQTFRDFEYLIVDGASTDRTHEIITEYSDSITALISEPDEGIYDAMNKGMAMASGEYLWFLNAGDEIYDPSTLQTLALAALDRPEIIYGDHELNFELECRRKLLKAPSLSYDNLSNGMVVSHQAVLCRRDICSSYDKRYRISADHDWLIRITQQAKRIRYCHHPISIYLMGGFSERQFMRGWRERITIIRRHYPPIQVWKNYGQFIVAGAKWVTKRVLGMAGRV